MKKSRRVRLFFFATSELRLSLASSPGLTDLVSVSHEVLLHPVDQEAKHKINGGQFFKSVEIRDQVKK